MSASHAFGRFLASLGTSHTDRRYADELEPLGLKQYQAIDHGRVKSIGTRLMSRLHAVWGRAAEEMREAAAALDAGRTAEQLGFVDALTATPEALEAVVPPFRSRRTDERWLERFDRDALARLDAVGRRYVETLLLFELQYDDASVPAVLTALGGEAAVAAMREALSSATGAMRSALARALQYVGTADDVARARAVLEGHPPDV
jgi:hypothetical protein